MSYRLRKESKRLIILQPHKTEWGIKLLIIATVINLKAKEPILLLRATIRQI